MPLPSLMSSRRSIRGPVLLSCGGQDQVWYSCGYAQAIRAELVACIGATLGAVPTVTGLAAKGGAVGILVG